MILRTFKRSTIALVMVATTTLSSVSSILLLKPDQQSPDDHTPIDYTPVVRFATTTPCETTADCPPMTPCTFETAATKSFLRFGGSRSLSSVDVSSPCGVQLVCIDNFCSQEQLPAGAHIRSFGGGMAVSHLVDPMPINDTDPAAVQIGTTIGGDCSETVSCPLLVCDSEPCPEMKCIAGICTLDDDTNVATTAYDLPAVQSSPISKVTMTLSAAGAAVQPRRNKGSKRPVVQARVSRRPKTVATKGPKQPKPLRAAPTKRPTRVVQPKKNRPKLPVATPKRKSQPVAATP